MLNALGRSVYLTDFEKQKPYLASAQSGELVFVSLHIGEEFGSGFADAARDMCAFLNGKGCRILADVSPEAAQQFGCEDVVALARSLGLWGLRADFGFSHEELLRIASQMPLAVNASTTTAAQAAALAGAGETVIAMHNFYPRPETGLDADFLRESTRELKAAGLQVYGFIAGDELLRGPLYKGLPTLEAHRGAAPLAAFADLALNYGLDAVFAGDPAVSRAERLYIEYFRLTGELCLPVKLSEEYDVLYGKVFTCRADSPAALIRCEESRTADYIRKPISPANCAARPRGSVTIDNIGYGRYSGEIQVTRADFAADEKVNVIGSVSEKHLLLLDCVRRGAKLRFVAGEGDCEDLESAE